MIQSSCDPQLSAHISTLSLSWFVSTGSTTDLLDGLRDRQRDIPLKFAVLYWLEQRVAPERAEKLFLLCLQFPFPGLLASAWLSPEDVPIPRN